MAKAKASKSRRERISELLTKIEGSLGDKPKATLADFIRLTQLERELEQEEQPGEVIVRWEELAERRDSGR